MCTKEEAKSISNALKLIGDEPNAISIRLGATIIFFKVD